MKEVKTEVRKGITDFLENSNNGCTRYLRLSEHSHRLLNLII